jgi:hypothetical protein
MAEQDPHIKISTEVDQSGLDKGLSEVDKKVKKTSEEGSSAFKEMFEALGLEKIVEKGFEVVKDFFSEAISGAKEAEVNAVQLKNSLENVGQAGNFDEIIENSEELSKKFVISKQDITKSQTALETYGKLTQKQIKDLEPVILNYSKKTSKSVSESTEDIIKGLEGQGRGLKTLGVELKAGGSTVDNFNQIMGEVGPKVEGAADAFNKTSAGGMAKFKLTIEELEESVGAKLLPAISDLAASFIPLLDEIGPLVDELMPILISSIKVIAPLFQSLGKIVVELLKPLGEMFGIVVSAISDLMPELMPILNILGDLAGTLLEDIIPVVKVFTELISDLLKVILPPFRKMLELVSGEFKIIGRVINIVYTAIGKLIDYFTNLTKSSLKTSGAMKVVGEVVNKITEAFTKAYEWVSKLLDKVEDFLGIKKDDTKKNIEAVGDAAKKAAEDQIKADNDVSKNKDKLAKKAKSDKEKEEDFLRKLNEKYNEDERIKLVKSYDEDLLALEKKGQKETALYQSILDQKNAKLMVYDQKIIDDKKKADKDADIQSQKNLEAQLTLNKDFNISLEQSDKEYNDAKTKDATLSDDDIFKSITDRYQKEKDARKKALDNSLEDNQNKIDGLQAQDDALVEYQIGAKSKLEEQMYDIQMDSLKKQHDADILAAGNDVRAKLKIEQDYQKKVKALKDQAIADDKTDRDKEFADATQLSNGLASLASNLYEIKKDNLDKGDKAAQESAKKQFEINKIMQISAAVISGIQGVINALTAKTILPEPFGEALRIAEASAVGISTLANISKIKSTQFSSSSSASATVPSSTAAASSSINANTSTTVGTQIPELNNHNKLQYQKVVVSQSDISKVSNKVNVIQNRSKMNP